MVPVVRQLRRRSLSLRRPKRRPTGRAESPSESKENYGKIRRVKKKKICFEDLDFLKME